ncbi:hypothetical protein [Sporomusa sp. KB1]|jgi:hypothetical protein|uniref:hypothetical protein n=1 Tax=Sporomusa sp. KB1 TaxID=943346 RepID=UPI0011A69F72|nr:hypothetical protein [Sporomusa sp. KB1]TWH49583.1 hypothetical protein Salpa_5821 [Sporomusa sp. KB1]
MSVFTEESVYCPEVTERFFINVKRIDKVLKDGEVISITNHRHVLAPGDNLNNEDSVVVAVANAVWTPEVIANYKASQTTTETETTIETEVI